MKKVSTVYWLLKTKSKNTEEDQMTSVALKKGKGQKQKIRRMEALNERRQKKKVKWGKNKKKLTEEQKKARTERLIENNRKKEERKQLKINRIESENANVLKKVHRKLQDLT